jgi:pseudouridine synthase
MARHVVADLAHSLEGLSRRAARRVRARLYLADGAALDMDAPLPLATGWTSGVFRSQALRWRLALPAVVALHKPCGVVTSRVGDHGAPTVFVLLDECPAADRIEPVGRLDRDTSGLLLLTADGKLLHRLTHPRRAVEREYVATVRGEPDDAALDAARSGQLTLRSGETPAPARIERIESLGLDSDGVPSSRWRVTLTEGRYHEVRRIFGAMGARVMALHRTAYGPLRLGHAPAELDEGAWRRLDDDQVRALYAEVGLPVPEPALEVELLGRAEASGDT